MENKDLLKWSKLLFLYILIFFMLREWLLPVMELTNTGHYDLLMLFIVICLVTNIAHVHTGISVGIKGAYIIWFMLYIQKPQDGPFIQSITESMRALVTGNWIDMSDGFKTMLFLILLWMTIYLIHHWLTIRRSILFFFILTVLFLALIDTFTKYNADASIIRTMILGLLLTGLLFTERLMSENKMKQTIGNYLKLLVPLFLLIGVSAAFAYAMPKQKAATNLPEPIENLVKWTNANINTVGKIGYVENDDQLGGDFERDSTPVFQYTAKEPQYMRVESKSSYTGRGWKNAQNEILVSTFDYGEAIKTSIPGGKKKNELDMRVKMDKKYSFLVQPYGVKEILRSNEKNNQFYIEIDSGKIRATKGKDRKVVDLLSYEYVYTKPIYKQKELDASRMQMIAKDTGITPKEKKENLQVPATLPKRVRDLATDITKDEKSVYDKANAVVDYFKTSGYRYSNINVGYPTGDEDYVDRFLFDTKVGYCDNFSTSMVMMMRSIGVPTRWVKGFSPGDKTASTEVLKDGMSQYSVTNNNAHSWVEVYIPEVGWMPFEPTIGFEGFDEQVEEETTQNEAPAKKEEEKKQEEQKKQKEQKKEQPKKEQEMKKEQQPKEQKATTTNTNNWLPIAFGIGVIVLAIVLFFTRHRWYVNLFIWYYNQKKPPIEQAYRVLLRRLARHNLLVREDGETLATFAKRVDQQLRTEDMSKLTNLMERRLYDPNADSARWDEFKECWKNLINETRG